MDFKEYNSCYRKYKYTKQTVDKKVTTINRNKKDIDCVVAYECNYCNYWHIGHKATRRKRTQTIENLYTSISM